MKRILIGAFSCDLLGTLEIILKHWGYRALATSRPGEFQDLLEGSAPDLILVGSQMLDMADTKLRRTLQRKVLESDNPLIILGRPDSKALPEPQLNLPVPVDVFALFALVQKHLEKHPRRNLRMEVRIPGMVCREQHSELAEVRSISSRGLFIKTTYRLEPQDRFQVIFPLLGMNRELELSGRAVYRVDPRPENNYRQGVGLEFVDLDETCRWQLERFLEQRLIGELSAGLRGEELDLNMLHRRTGPGSGTPC